MKSIKTYPDASRIRVFEDGSWLLNLADGTKQRGTAENAEAALEAAEQARNSWIVGVWDRGTWAVAGRSSCARWLVPLKG